MKRTTILLSALLMVLLACNFGTGLAPGETQTSETSDTSASSNGFSAQAEEGKVKLKWEAIDGAEYYLIEILLFDEYFALGELPAGQLAYEDEVPGETDYTYRLTSLDQDGERGETRDITVFVPEKQSAPASVTYTLDLGDPLIDLSNLDPATIDPNMLDPDNFDPSMLLPQDLSARATIGPEGGDLSVTGSNGVTFVLTVPPGALLFEELITLSPISEISGLPLSGGMQAAVLIEPQDMYFTTPARLKFILPEGYASPQGLLQVGFAFEANGQDFHLSPFLEDFETSLGGGHLAKLSLAPWMDGDTSGMGVQDGGGYGRGNGTAQDVQNVNPPSNAQNRSAQEAAKAQLDEYDLAPIAPSPSRQTKTNKNLDSIRNRVSKAETIIEVVSAMESLKQLQDSNGRHINSKTRDKLIKQISEKLAELLLKGEFKNCLAKDSMEAQEAVRRLKDPQNSVEKTIAENVIKKLSQMPVVSPNGTFGDKWEETIDRVKQCTVVLRMDSTITGVEDETTIKTTANPEKVSLQVALRKSGAGLKASFIGSMIMNDLKVKASGKNCKGGLEIPVDPLTLRFTLDPQYKKDGNVVDFYLDIGAEEGSAAVSAEKTYPDCPIIHLFSSGGKASWYSMYVIVRDLESPGNTGWKINRGASEIINAKKTVKVEGIPGPQKSQLAEKTDFEIVIMPAQ